MQKTIRCFGWLGLVLAAFSALPDACDAVTRLAFQEEFGGKGSGVAQFGREIYLTFDDSGNLYRVDEHFNRRSVLVGELKIKF